VLKGRLSLPRLIDLTATTPAKLFGLWPSKGEIRPGADADLILFNPLREWTMNRASLHMAADWSAYEGIPIKGRIEKVFSRGEMIVDGDECLARRGRGRYLHRTLDFFR
jgi:dihydropyrimidinase